MSEPSPAVPPGGPQGSPAAAKSVDAGETARKEAEAVGLAQPLRAGMENVGTLLCATRMRLDLDLLDVSKALKIQYNYLVAIEDGRFEDLPARVYATGFVRAYADYLGLDGGEVVRRFREEAEGLPRKKPKLDFPVPNSDGGLPSGSLIGLSIVAGLIVYGGWYFLAVAPHDTAELVNRVPERIADLPAVEPEQTTALLDAFNEGMEQAGGDGVTRAPALSEPAAEPDAPEDVGADDQAEEAVAAVEPPAPATQPDPPAPIAATPEPEPKAPEPVETKVEEPPAAAPSTAAEVTPPEPPAVPSVPPAKVPPANVPSEEMPSPAETVAEAPEPAQPEPAQSEPETPVAPEPVAVADVEAEATPAPAPMVEDPPAVEPPAVEPAQTPVTPAQPVAEPAPAPVVAATPEPAPEPAPEPEVPPAPVPPAVMLRAVEDSWIQIRNGEDLVLTRRLGAGQSYAVPTGMAALTLTTGNAGGLEILLHGEALPSLGKSGAVRRDIPLTEDGLRALFPEFGTDAPEPPAAP